MLSVLPDFLSKILKMTPLGVNFFKKKHTENDNGLYIFNF